MRNSIGGTLLLVVSFVLLNSAGAFGQPQHAIPYPRVDTAMAYKVDPNWPLEKPAGGDWAAMSGIAVAPDGNVWTFNRGKIPVQIYTPEGKLVKAWGEGMFSQPHSIALDSKGRVYVADRNNSRIQIFDSNGKFLAEWKNIITPWYLEITKNDEIFVCGSSPMRWSEVPTTQGTLATPPKDQLMLKLDTEGRIKLLAFFPKGENGKEKPGDLNWVHTMAVATDGTIYFGDVQGKRAQKFVPVGTQSSN